MKTQMVATFILIAACLMAIATSKKPQETKYIFLPHAQIAFDASRPWKEHTLEERIFMAMYDGRSRLNESDIQEIRERYCK
jgi:hypothetical protein